MDNIVTRLQRWVDAANHGDNCPCLMHASLAEIKQLRTLGNMMTFALHHAYKAPPEDVADLLATWEEVVRD